MRGSDAARVGIVVLLGAGLLVWATFFLRGNLGRGDTYTRQVSFANAQGIQTGAYVRVRGVEVGTVESVGLGSENRPLLTLRIREEYRLGSEDSVRIVGGLFGFTPPYVEITPGGRRDGGAPGPIIPGEESPNVEQMLSNADELLRNLNSLTVRMTKLTEGMAQVAGDPRLQANLRRTATNFAELSDSGVAIARNMERATARTDELIASFKSTAASLDRTLKRADTLLAGFSGTAEESRELVREARGVIRETGEVARGTQTTVRSAGALVEDTRTLLGENRARVRELLDSLSGSLKQLDTTLVETRTFLADPALRTDLKETAGNIRDASQNLKKITGDIESLTGDPKLQEELRETITGLRDASQQAAAVFERVRGVLGTGRRSATSIGQRLRNVEVGVDLLRGTRSNRTRLDFDATIPWSNSTFYRLGFYDFGESNKLNLQSGQAVRRGVWARYGIHASKLGVGLDVGDRLRPPLSLDVFGVDRPQVDVRGNLRVLPYLDLTVGLDDATGRPDPVIGVRYRK